jgi:RHS repeat-associated protein
MQAAAPKPKAIRRAHPGQGVPVWHASKWPKQRSYVENGERGLGRDHLYSVAALTNAAGAVVERYRYDTFGNRTTLAPDGITTRAVSSYNQQVGFTGRYEDKETKLWYFRSRYYSGTLGRFIGRDSLGYVSGYSQYFSYFAPNNVDPMGTNPPGEQGGGGGHAGRDLVACLESDDCLTLLDKIEKNIAVFKLRVAENIAKRPDAVLRPNDIAPNSRPRKTEAESYNGHREQTNNAVNSIVKCVEIFNRKLASGECGKCTTCNPIPVPTIERLREFIPAPITIIPQAPIPTVDVVIPQRPGASGGDLLSVPDDSVEYAKPAAYAVASVGAGYLCYRAGRLIANALVPPSWPLLPANLALP